MSFRPFHTAVAVFSVLTACVPATPTVSEFNGDSVKLVYPDVVNYPAARVADERAKLKAEANRICGMRGRRAEPASARRLPDYQYEYLFLCV